VKWELLKHGKRGLGLSVANYPKSRRVGVRVGRRELACIIWRKACRVERVPVLWLVPGAAGWKARVQ
jgi:hypothetical protein